MDQGDDRFQTADLQSNLRRRSVRGGVLVMASQAAQFALSLGSTAVLARILTPDDFGLMAMVAALTSFLALFLDLGLSSATVQRRHLTSGQVSGLFWANVALGLLLAAIMVAIGPWVARFYGRGELRGVMMATALGFVMAGTSVQHYALLERELRFATLARIEVTSVAIGIAAAIAAALLGAGYWALVCMLLVQQAVGTAGAWLSSGWRPGRPTRVSGLRPLLSFGLGLAGFNTLNYLSRNLDNLIIGRVAGGQALGLYSKAYSLLMLPVSRVRGPVSAVVVPALSRLQDDERRFKRYYLKAITGIASIGMPIAVFLFVFADDVVRIVLGPRWAQSAVLFKILAPAAFVETFNTVGSWACTPFGRSGRLVRWQLVATCVTVGSFLVGARWGAFGVAAAFSASTLALRLPAMAYLLRHSPIRPVDVLNTLRRPAFASLAPGAIFFLARPMLVHAVGPSLSLVAATPGYAAAYVLMWIALPGGRRSFQDLRALVRELRPSQALSAEI